MSLCCAQSPPSRLEIPSGMGYDLSGSIPQPAVNASHHSSAIPAHPEPNSAARAPHLVPPIPHLSLCPAHPRVTFPPLSMNSN